MTQRRKYARIVPSETFDTIASGLILRASGRPITDRDIDRALEDEALPDTDANIARVRALVSG